MEYVKAVHVSDGSYKLEADHSVTYIHPQPKYSTNAVRLLALQEDFPELSACEYIQLNFELPVQIQQVYISGSSETLAIFSHNDEATCVCEPVSLNKAKTTLDTITHTPSNCFYFFWSSTDTNSLHLNIGLDIHQSTLNQILLTKYVTNNTVDTLTKITQECHQEYRTTIEKITSDSKNKVQQVLQDFQLEMKEIATQSQQDQSQRLAVVAAKHLDAMTLVSEDIQRHLDQKAKWVLGLALILIVFHIVCLVKLYQL